MNVIAAGARLRAPVTITTASILGPAWFSAIRAPFPDVNYLATRGVTPGAAREYVQAGAGVVAFGASAAAGKQRGHLASLVKDLQQAHGNVTTSGIGRRVGPHPQAWG